MAHVYLCTLVLYSIIRINSATNAIKQEYCVGESFNPQCPNGEVILMHSALYGRMTLGQCLPTDLGHMGCQSDVLSQFDHECSGKETCEVFITYRHINAQGGCMKGLQSYLEAEYICVKALNVESRCESNQAAMIETNQDDFYLADLQLNACALRNKGLTIQAKDGQVMNISQISLQNTITNLDVYGTVKDVITGKRVIFSDGPRDTNLLLSTSNKVEITVSDTEASGNRFLLHFKVLGCPNMPPPQGAWMTRDGDVMEIGCHTGAKMWSLECKENQWVGAIGQCGVVSGSMDRDKSTDKPTESEPMLSINTMLFGISSLVIFLSAVIFLTGVCLLKRKLRLPMSSGLPDQKASSHMLQQDIIANGFPSLPCHCPPDPPMYPVHGAVMEPGYKSLRLAQGTTVLNTNQLQSQESEVNATPAYMNATGPDASDSVKYYVLEDAAKYN